jgi:hypothetical protein
MISNKLIGLAAVAFLCGSAGFSAVGCSSSDDVADDDDDAAVASSSSSGGKDGGGKTSSSSSGEDPGTCEPTATYSGTWYPSATATAGSCTADNLAAFEAVNPKTFKALYESVSGDCRSCIFTDIGDGSTEPTSLAAIGYVSAGADVGSGIQNFAWCIGNKSGKPACGKSYGEFTECGDTVCKDCGTIDDTGKPDDDRAACTEAAYDQDAPGVCISSNLDKVQADCGEDGLAFESECGTDFFADIAALCGPAGAGDAGTGDGGN